MKATLSFLTVVGLVLAGCADAVTPDVGSTVQAGVFATLTALPTEAPAATPTATETPAPTLTPDNASTLQADAAATLTARPTERSVPAPTETPLPTPTKTPAPTPTRGAVPTAPPYTHTLETYRGQGFSFRYPAGARLEELRPRRMARQRVSPATSEVRVTGPQVWVKAGDADWGYRGPAYELVVRTYENPGGLDSEAWARDCLLALWREARERKPPSGSLPVTEEGEIDERKVASTVVSGQPAFLVWFYTFDSTRPAYYFAVEGQVVELSFRLYPVANQPLAMVQRDVYVLILDTLSFE